ncbi:TnsA-like heteromeric transposase endonuclease subunit [Actinoplanes sp. NPDC026670]|uniref:TnsA-like heteromeric transposase endonuclease subunit n=1 Tax=Actinoplanes sp. NPDC026670 TaxID=3154700 RepID=UPI0033F0CF8D
MSEAVKLDYRQADGTRVTTRLDRVRVDELVTSRPVREFRAYQGRKHYSGWYWSSTMQDQVVYESLLEKNRIMLADFEDTVTSIVAQPFQLTGQDGTVERRHIPDLLLVSASGVVTVVDVKPARRLADPTVAAVFAWTEQVVASRGWLFEVWTGADAGLLANVRWLAGYRRRAVIQTSLLPAAMELADKHRTLGELEAALTAQLCTELTSADPDVDAYDSAVIKQRCRDFVRPVVMHLLWTRQLRAPLDLPLQATTPIAPRPVPPAAAIRR